MACYIIAAGDFYGLSRRPKSGDYTIAADAGYLWCVQEHLTPDLLLGDFDSMPEVPDFPHLIRVPEIKDDTDMMLAIKKGLAMGQTEFYIYGALGGARSDHTIANLQSLLYLTRRGARGTLYGNGELYTALCNGEVTFPAQESGILSIFCFGPDAEGVDIEGGQYPLHDATLSAEFPLGVSNHFQGHPITVRVRRGMLLLSVRGA
jgi:thiamine pyrophosphokinase